MFVYSLLSNIFLASNRVDLQSVIYFMKRYGKYLKHTSGMCVVILQNEDLFKSRYWQTCRSGILVLTANIPKIKLRTNGYIYSNIHIMKKTRNK